MIVLAVAIVSVNVVDADESLEVIANFYESNRDLSLRGKMVETSDWIGDSDSKRSKEMVCFLDPPYFLRSIENNSVLEYITMVNNQYAAVMGRSEDGAKWELEEFSTKGEKRYDEIHNGMLKASPAYGVCFIGGAYLPHEWRTGNIINKRTAKVEGKEIEIYQVEAEAADQNGDVLARLTRTYHFQSGTPPLLLEVAYRNPPAPNLSRSQYTEWTEKDGVYFPTERIIASIDDSGKFARPNIHRTYTHDESLDGFEREQTYLSYYGLPEPIEAGNHLLWGILIGTAMLFVAWAWRRRTAKG